MAEKLDFEALWQELAPHVRSAIRRHPSKDLSLAADDLEQEVRIRVWQTLSGDRKGRFASFYYYKVVNSAIIDALRKHRGVLPHHQREEDEQGLDEQRFEAPLGSDLTANQAASAPETELGQAQRQQKLKAALARLPKDRAQAMGLFLQGFSVPEIAELMNCDENRAHNLTYRGKRALSKLMADEHE